MLAVIPASLLGIFAMIYNGVLPAIWIQNVVFMVLCGATAYNLTGRKINHYIIAILSLFLLILTFFMHGLDGVHRWVSLAGININTAMVVVPVLLAVVYYMLTREKTGYAVWVIIICAGILFMQPDASQLTGFAIPVIMFLFIRKINVYVKYLLSGLLIGLIILSWIFLDSLEPVTYVEGILNLLYDISPLWMILGLTALILIPLSFLLIYPKEQRVLSAGIALYYGIIILSTVFGNFPVPIMGYGVSSIVGYWNACIVTININERKE